MLHKMIPVSFSCSNLPYEKVKGGGKYLVIPKSMCILCPHLGPRMHMYVSTRLTLSLSLPLSF